MKFVADTADIVRGEKCFMWSNFAQHDKFYLSCGSKLLHITSNFAPHDTIVCHVGNDKLPYIADVEQFDIAPYDKIAPIVSCGEKLLVMWSNFDPHDKQNLSC